ncbi:MAG TPA: hypothetical protein VGS97_01265 [Actinocrinis sp.]|uniref:hypothetical protein n=1 Tax=Actinocrinis sp. TaxID=1920516 RepID=UPI002DDD5840|nr:hypothetical protein [Actinocrinis sp.]HEV2342695.1 hypothetical protein [Actinocrinis sp.]
MSSSGVIYAIIVGAWAVYLVPMWLRREDELNRARETQRYAAAIKVLANKEAFERRWARPSEAEGARGAEAVEALPIAAGQGFVPTSRAVRHTTARPSTRQPQPQPRKAAANSVVPNAKPTKRSITVAAPAAATAAVAATMARNAVTARIAESGADATRAQTAPQRQRQRRLTGSNTAGSIGGGEAAPKSPHTATRMQPQLRSRTGLMARRRRVVALLFAVSTFGALVSADLGVRYLWAMAIPAVLLSAYIARLRRDERIRVAARAAKRAAAAQSQAAAQATREAALARAEAEQARATQAEAARMEAQAEADQRRHTETARRRASAAARARAQAFAHEVPDLRQASNG